MIDELIPGKCYKISNKSDNRKFWNTATLGFIKGDYYENIKCYYGIPFIFLEKVNIETYPLGETISYLKCLIGGKIAYFDEWKNLTFEEAK